MARLLFVVLLTFYASVSAAQDPGSLAIVKRGGDVYLNGGADAAINSWFAGSSPEVNALAVSQSNMLRQIEAHYGKPESVDIVQQSPISPRSERIYFTINYAKGIVYAQFEAYRTKEGVWIATAFKFHTVADEVFPSSLLSRN